MSQPLPTSQLQSVKGTARGPESAGQPLRRIESTFVALPSENIDTDQICPARFLTSTARSGFGPALFADWRYDAAGAPRPEFPMNRPEAVGARALVTGRNFGCGSSREHAVWALRENGIQAVIATSVADIFKRNALKNGVAPVVIDAASHGALLSNPSATLVVDIERLLVSWPGGEARFELDPFARHCLMEGVDELGYLLKQDAVIAAYEAAVSD
jgi:3-isopropylmalate/(R)-2-methylmalate dehydratase small subunit